MRTTEPVWIPGCRSCWPPALGLVFAALVTGCGANIGVPIDIDIDLSIIVSDTGPAWSPDGTHVAYAHAELSLQGIWLVDTTGTNAHQILAGDWVDVDWSPDGTQLAVAGNGIHVANASGGGIRQLTTEGNLPRWSPVANRIAFQTTDTSGVRSIGIVSPDGSGLRSLAPPDTESWSEPDWSPDGSRLVHVRRLGRNGQTDLFVMDTTGGAVVRLATDGSDDFGPAWSPDGQWIAWSIGTFSPANELWIMKSDGTEARMLTYGGDPSWSPDSRRIAFNVLQFNVVHVCVIDIATSRIVQITR